MNSKCFSLMLAMVATTLTAWAQVDRATLTGTLHDPSGAVVTDAKLTVTYSSSGLVRDAESNGAGAVFHHRLAGRRRL